MAIVNKRYFWGHKPYNTKTGLFKGEKTHHSDGSTTSWLGKSSPPPTGKKSGMGAKVYDD